MHFIKIDLSKRNKMNKIRTTILLVLLAIIPLKSMAWGINGHRIIAHLATDMLSCSAKHKIHRVLNRQNPAMVANWADFIRADSTINEFSDWHYTNLNSGLSQEAFDVAVMGTSDGQGVYQVIRLTEELKRDPKNETKLRLLIHIVGDVFQPMHLGRATDRGGNDVEIKWYGRKTNLHALWDNPLISSQALSYTEYAEFIKRLYPMKKSKYSPELVRNNAWQTYQFTEHIYATVSEISDESRYIYNNRQIWENRLAASACLLATILDYIY